MAYIGKQPVVGNFQVCDAISVVNGQAAYTMQVASANVEPENANHMLVSLNGILQKPGSSFTISGSTITFASNLVTNDVIDFIILLGDVLNIGTPSDGTVATASIAANAVTAAKLNNDIVSGLTALGATPPDTDEFLVSDAGTIKRVDYSYIKGGGILLAFNAEEDYASTTSSTNTSFVDVGSDIAITPTTTSDKVWIGVHFKGSIGGGAGQYKIVRTVGGSDTDVLTWDISASTSRDYGKWYKDSPSTTSEITYKLQMKSTQGNAGHTIYLSDNGFVEWQTLVTAS